MYKFHKDTGLRGVFQNWLDGYPRMIEKIRLRRDFIDGKIENLQKNIDEWYTYHVSIMGRAIITNYIYMLCTR